MPLVANPAKPENVWHCDSWPTPLSPPCVVDHLAIAIVAP